MFAEVKLGARPEKKLYLTNADTRSLEKQLIAAGGRRPNHDHRPEIAQNTREVR